jgi:predicted ribosomally synthesized peptide with SipW-like signal peptide
MLNRYAQLALRNMARSLGRLAFAGFAVWAGVHISFIPGTNASFSDEEAVSGNAFSAGYWIPTLSMSVTPVSPDGDDGFYETTPCVTLSYAGLSSGTATIWYELSDDGDPVSGGTRYSGTCIPIPDGDPTHFQAIAVSDVNLAWTSAVVSEDFKVDTSSVSPGDVLINEVMWMGSSESTSDEWIELYNTTGHDISIKNWNIEGAVSGPGGHLEISGGPGGPSDDIVIPAHGYFLIAHYDDSHSNSALAVDPDLVKSNLSLHNTYSTNGSLILKDENGDTIDKTPTPVNSNWPAGYNDSSFKKSMERNADPGDGTDANDWHTCEDSGCMDDDFWKSETAGDYGTPKAENLSENEGSNHDFSGVSHEDTEVELPPTEILQEIFDPVKEESTDERKESDENGEKSSDGEEVEEQPVEALPVVSEADVLIPFPVDAVHVEDILKDVAVSDDVTGSEPTSESDTKSENAPTQEEVKQEDVEEEDADEEDAKEDNEDSNDEGSDGKNEDEDISDADDE